MGAIATKLQNEMNSLKQPLISDNTNCSVKKCRQLQRIIECLKFYQSLDIMHSDDDKNKMMHFFKNKYKSTLNDYIHIVTEHSDDLECIFNLIISDYNLNCCNFIGCSMLRRHHRDRTKDEAKNKLMIIMAMISYFIEIQWIKYIVICITSMTLDIE